ncbi:MAG TPA: hypothetical protein VLK57_19800 [Pseudonocardia sp.]|nr:hypothetical protein [Pseudonocardia sp.]
MTTRLGPALTFDHLDRLSDQQGLFEHALFSEPRRAHGYCVDDVARGLVVVCREAHRTPVLDRLERLYLDFVQDAIDGDGQCHNRMTVAGDWCDDASLGDWWGRALWGLGTAAVHGSTPELRARALVTFRVAAEQRSPHTRAMAGAALGAAEVLGGYPDEKAARDLLSAVVAAVPPGPTSPAWLWPEPRLRYGNGILPQALIVAGAALSRPPVLARGLALLSFLLKIETRGGHLSVTPGHGRGPGEGGPQYDQQPIEVAAIADCCASAYQVTGDPRWLAGIRLAWNWFLGRNDSSTMMFDPDTGGGYDGLQSDGPNLNQGAESTLAMLLTAQYARTLRELR